MKQLFASLLVILSLFVGIPARADFKLFHATWNDPASTQPYVLTSDLPLACQPCLWTATRSDVWANPVTVDQVKLVAATARAGGTFNWRRDNNGLLDVDAGAFVMLDGEGDVYGSRSDAELRRMIDLYRYWYARSPGAKSSANFCVYAFRYGPPNGQWHDAMDRKLELVRGCEARKAEVGDLVQKMPVLLIEWYVYDPLDEWLEAREFEVETLRRLYPGKPVYGLLRCDDPLKGPYPTPFLEKYVRRARSALDGGIVWGDRLRQLDLIRRLDAVR